MPEVPATAAPIESQIPRERAVESVAEPDTATVEATSATSVSEPAPVAVADGVASPGVAVDSGVTAEAKPEDAEEVAESKPAETEADQLPADVDVPVVETPIAPPAAPEGTPVAVEDSPPVIASPGPPPESPPAPAVSEMSGDSGSQPAVVATGADDAVGESPAEAEAVAAPLEQPGPDTVETPVSVISEADSGVGLSDAPAPAIETPAEAITVEEPVKQDAEATPVVSESPPVDTADAALIEIESVPSTSTETPGETPAEQEEVLSLASEPHSPLGDVAAGLADEHGLEAESWLVAMKFAANQLAGEGDVQERYYRVHTAILQESADARELMTRACRRATNEAFPDFPNDERVSIAKHLAATLKEMADMADDEVASAAIAEALS